MPLIPTDEQRGLYVAFNKSVQTHATKLFAGTGIEARTAHSLAYREYGALLEDRMGLLYLKTQDKVRLFGADPYVFSLRVGATVPRLDSAAVARAAQETVIAFCRSADAELGTHHVRLHPAVSADEEGMEDVRAHVLRVARKIWKDAIDPHGENRVEHDTYLMLWQLSEPDRRTTFDTQFPPEGLSHSSADGGLLHRAQRVWSEYDIPDSKEAVMGRTPGATNRTPREIAKEAAHQAKEAKLKARLQKKNVEIAVLKAKKRAK